MSSLSVKPGTIQSIPFNGKNWLIWQQKVLSYFALMQWDVLSDNPSTPPARPTTNTSTSHPAATSATIHNLQSPQSVLRGQATPTIEPVLTGATDEVKAKVMHFLFISLSDEVMALFIEFIGSKDPVVFWNALRSHYQRDTLARKTQLREQLFSVKYRSFSSMESYVAKVNELVLQLHNLHESISDGEKLHALFKGLPDEYQPFMSAFKLIPNTTYADTVKHLVEEEETLKIRKSKSVSSLSLIKPPNMSAYITKPSQPNHRPNIKSKSRHCKYCQLDNHWTSDCKNTKKQLEWYKQNDQPLQRFLSSNTSRSNSNTQSNRDSQHQHSKPVKHCQFHPKSKTHTTDECRSRPSTSTPRQDNVTAPNVTLANLRLNCQIDFEHFFILDSGSTTHVINDEALFCESEELWEEVTLPTGQIETITRSGTMKFKTEFTNVTLTNVKLCPTFGVNLLSVPLLMSKGALVNSQDEHSIQVSCNNAIVMKATRINLMLVVPFEPVVHCTRSITFNTNQVPIGYERMHARLGHPSPKSMKLMNLITNDSPLHTCHECAISKSTRTPFTKHLKRAAATYRMERIHCDICSIDKLYILVVIDEFSRKPVIYMLQAKAEAAGKIVEFIKYGSNFASATVKEVLSDNGGEFVNDELQSFYTSQGIKQVTTCAYTPQNNGLVERFNRTLMNATRCLLSQASLGKTFLCHAVKAAAYLLQYRPCPTNTSVTILEAWTQAEPDFKHLKTFGCNCYFKRLPVEDKVSDRAKPAVMIGYDETKVNAYLVLDISNSCEESSRDVSFEETNFSFAQSYQIQHQGDVPLESYYNSMHDVIPADDVSDTPDQSLQRTRSRQKPDHHGKINWHDLYDEDLTYMFSSHIDDEWASSMRKEVESLREKHVYQIVDNVPANHRTITTHWIHKIKPDGTYKSRLVADGYKQIEHLDYSETASPTLHMKTLKVILSIANETGMQIQHLDIKTAFLNSPIDEPTYIRLPDGFQTQSRKYARLLKCLYGLKQAPLQWFRTLSGYILELNFTQLRSDSCLFMKQSQSSRVILIAVYVDDILLLSHHDDAVEVVELQATLLNKFEGVNLGPVSKILNIEITRCKQTMTINQSSTIESYLARFGLVDANTVSTPCSTSPTGLASSLNEESSDLPFSNIIGCLLWVSIVSRPDISFSVNHLSRHTRDYTLQHFTDAKRVLRYLKKTKSLSLVYQSTDSAHIQCSAYCDSSHADDAQTRRSTFGNVICLNRNPISWTSKQINHITHSTAESEYTAIYHTVKEMQYFHHMLQELHQSQFDVSKQLIVYTDSQSAIDMATSPNNFNQRSKHMDLKYHFLKEQVGLNVLKLQKVPSADNTADVFTKPLPRTTFEHHRAHLGLQ